MNSRHHWLAPCLLLPTLALAEVREMQGDELIETYVTGISIEQVVTDKPFDSDDEVIRESLDEQRNMLGALPPAVAVANVDALHREKTLDSLLADVGDPQVRDLAEDAITQTALGPRLEMNLDRIAAETGIRTGGNAPDFDTVRGMLLELMPTSAGYQLEFNQR